MIVIFRYRYPNKDVYVGQFKHDLFHGVGRYEAASGMTHEGEYKLSLIFFFFFFFIFFPVSFSGKENVMAMEQ